MTKPYISLRKLGYGDRRPEADALPDGAADLNVAKDEDLFIKDSLGRHTCK
jgi:hypothetical protein